MIMEEELSQNSATSIGPQPVGTMEQELSHISAARLSPQPLIAVKVMEGESQDSATDTPLQPYHFILSVSAKKQTVTSVTPAGSTQSDTTEFPPTNSLELSQPSHFCYAYIIVIVVICATLNVTSLLCGIPAIVYALKSRKSYQNKRRYAEASTWCTSATALYTAFCFALSLCTGGAIPVLSIAVISSYVDLEYGDSHYG